MKIRRVAVRFAAIIGVTGLSFGSIFLAAQTKTTQPDSVVAIVADAQGLPLVLRNELPLNGTFWTVKAPLPCVTAPLPFPPGDQSFPIYKITEGQFLVDGTGGELLSQLNGSTPLSSGDASSVVQQQADEILNQIAWIQDAQLPISSQMAVRGEYFDNTNLTDPSVLTNQDASLNFSWTNAWPKTPVPTNAFSVRWTGKLKVRKEGDHIFYLNINPRARARLWVGNAFVGNHEVKHHV